MITLTDGVLKLLIRFIIMCVKYNTLRNAVWKGNSVDILHQYGWRRWKLGISTLYWIKSMSCMSKHHTRYYSTLDSIVFTIMPWCKQQRCADSSMELDKIMEHCNHKIHKPWRLQCLNGWSTHTLNVNVLQV